MSTSRQFNKQIALTGTSLTIGSLIYNTNGNTGVGTTSPAFKLDVNGPLSASSTITIPNTTNNYSLTSGSLAVGGDIIINGNRLLFTTTNLSPPTLGTRSSGTKIVLFPQTNVTQGDFSLGVETGNMWFQVPSLSLGHGYKLYQGTSANMVLTSSGNVGIGTTSPVYKVDVTGSIRATSWLPGQVIKVTILSSGDVGFNSDQTIYPGSWTSIASYSYTPSSAQSFVIVEAFVKYSVGGYGSDIYYSQITVAGGEIATGYQNWSGGASGSGTRSGVIFPLLGRYTNSDLNAKTISINIIKGADDNITFYTGSGFSLTITEIGR